MLQCQCDCSILIISMKRVFWSCQLSTLPKEEEGGKAPRTGILYSEMLLVQDMTMVQYINSSKKKRLQIQEQ